MKKYLFIAEKPSLMRDVQSVYNKNQSLIMQQVGIIDFTALAGHVCQLVPPNGYDAWKGRWEELELPMIPKQFKIQVIPGKEKMVNNLKKQITKEHYDGFIVGTDADIEGNGIYYLLQAYLNLKKENTLRFFEHSLTENEILKSLLSMTGFWTTPQHVHMTEAFLIRSHMDWLIGMNFTVGFTIRSKNIMRVGRVKTPTLKLIYDNCESIDHFVPKKDYEIKVTYQDSFSGILLSEDLKSNQKFETELEAKQFIQENLADCATVESIEQKKETLVPSPLYKLSDLQTEAGNLYGFSPAYVLELVQSLYETHKIVSYPRTDCRYISTEKAMEFSKLLQSMKCFPELESFVSSITEKQIKKVQSNQRIVNDKEVQKSSHDALLPTGKKPNISNLNEDEKRICLLIYKRLLAFFLPPLLQEKATVITKNNEFYFLSRGKKILDRGFTLLYPEQKVEENPLPDHLKKEMVCQVGEFVTEEKTTKPPQRFSQATLVNAMENISRYLSNQEKKKIMKEAKGIGTPATRSEIISSLLKSGYMQEEGKGKKKHLYITKKGKEYIQSAKEFSIADPVLTADWEEKLKKLRQGELEYSLLEKEMLDFVVSATKEIVGGNYSPVKQKTYTCPFCKKGQIRKFDWGWGCSRYKTGCSFSLGKVISGIELSEEEVESLIQTGSTKPLSMVSKTGKKFTAKLILKKKKIEFEFVSDKKV